MTKLPIKTCFTSYCSITEVLLEHLHLGMYSVVPPFQEHLLHTTVMFVFMMVYLLPEPSLIQFYMGTFLLQYVSLFSSKVRRM